MPLIVVSRFRNARSRGRNARNLRRRGDGRLFTASSILVAKLGVLKPLLTLPSLRLSDTKLIPSFPSESSEINVSLAIYISAFNRECSRGHSPSVPR